jgi:hypothetical protein
MPLLPPPHVIADIMYERILNTVDSISHVFGLLREEAKPVPGVNPHGYKGGKETEGSGERKEKGESEEILREDKKG